MAKTNFYSIPDSDKAEIYKQLSDESKIPPFAVEKDWWVVQVLAAIFEMSVGKHLVFKGGTSLSKAWNLISRFSEDVDLAIDPKFLGFEGDLKKKDITALRKAANQYISNTFYPELKQRMAEKGFTNVTWDIINTQESDQDPKIMLMYYPNVIESVGYIQPKVQIEIGCRSLREPLKIVEFNTLIDEYYSQASFAMPAIKVPTVIPERTFLEKIFLLHEEFSKPTQAIRVERLSRHLYDVYQLSKTEIKQNALNDTELYETIVKHRYNFTRISKVDYNLHQPQTINPIPPQEVIKAWEADYNTMLTEMIYGDAPTFEELIQELTLLKTEINNLNWKMNVEFAIPKQD
jgi:predicted nucleotidyltransferase component of viral defense system